MLLPVFMVFRRTDVQSRTMHSGQVTFEVKSCQRDKTLLLSHHHFQVIRKAC
jgi:hypothetical protein